MAADALFADDMQEIVESFLVETRELLEGLDNDLLLLERAPAPALVDQVFRSVHTIKGMAGFLGLEQLTELAHHFEDVLNRLRRGTLTVQPGTLDTLLAAFDQMRALVRQIEDRAIEPVELGPVLTRLKALSEGSTPFPEADTDDAALDEVGTDDAALDEPEAPAREAQPGGTSATPRTGGGETIRVPVDRLDALMDLVGELVLSRNRLLQLLADAGTDAAEPQTLRDVRGATAQLDLVTTELQAAVMRTRMVQIGRVFARFPRLVRDLAADVGKQIRLVLEGEETELDKSLTEELADPLVHLVRNAVDHGVEDAATRTARGKPAEGTVRLAAAHEGDHVLLVVEDDGAGIDPEALTAKAVERGLITAREAAEMTETEALQLIFRPGFSTARQVSQLSGRGVGMDVVKTHLTRLNGSVTIESTPGAGTRFTLKLPLTLAIIQSLLVRVGDETFGVPLHAVDEVVELDPAARTTARTTVHGRAVLRHREAVVPLLRLGRALAVAGYAPPERQEFAVVVEVGHHRVGLLVDALVGQKEIVIKPLGDFLKRPPCIAGSAILGDGRVVMVLDLGGLLGRSRRDADGPAPRTDAPGVDLTGARS